jgi:diguanylate cyclase (GGDEF)-like protein
MVVHPESATATGGSLCRGLPQAISLVSASAADKSGMFGSSTTLSPEVQAALGKLTPGSGATFPPEHEAEFAEMQSVSRAADTSLVTTAVGAGLLFHLLLISERQLLHLHPSFFVFRGLPETVGLLLLLLLSTQSKYLLAARGLLVLAASGAVVCTVAHLAFPDLASLLAMQVGVAMLVLVFCWLPQLPVRWTAGVAASMVLANVVSLAAGTIAVPLAGNSGLIKLDALSAPVFAAAFAILCSSARQAEARRNFLALRTAAMAEAGTPEAPEDARHLDASTRVANRDAFEIRFRAAWDHAAGRRNSVALLLFGIDDLQNMRRDLGSKFTDTLEREVARILKEGLRRSDDMVARFDNQHFVVMLPGVGTDGATQIAERLRGCIEELVVYLGAERRRATVTVGVASLRARKATDRQRLIDAAATALEQGRSFGRNLVFIEGRGCLPSMA